MKSPQCGIFCPRTWTAHGQSDSARNQTFRLHRNHEEVFLCFVFLFFISMKLPLSTPRVSDAWARHTTFFSTTPLRPHRLQVCTPSNCRNFWRPRRCGCSTIPGPKSLTKKHALPHHLSEGQRSKPSRQNQSALRQSVGHVLAAA